MIMTKIEMIPPTGPSQFCMYILRSVSTRSMSLLNLEKEEKTRQKHSLTGDVLPKECNK